MKIEKIKTMRAEVALAHGVLQQPVKIVSNLSMPLQRIKLKSLERDISTLRTRLGHGLYWKDITNDSEWVSFKIFPCASFTLQQVDPLLMIRTPVGDLIFSDHTLLQLASHVQFSSSWSIEVISEIAKLATANMDSSLIKAFGGAVEVFIISPDSITNTHDYQPFLLSLTSKVKNQSFTFSFKATKETASQWLTNTTWKNITPPNNFDSLPIRGKFFLGSTTLTFIELRELEIGDAISIKNLEHNKNQIKIQFANFHLIVEQLDNTQYKIINKEWSNLMDTNDEISHNENFDHAIRGEENSAVESTQALPITLNFTVGKVQLTFRELQNLAVGSVIDLGRKADTRVQITAQGKQIATGELVSVEGHLAVELIQFSP